MQGNFMLFNDLTNHIFVPVILVWTKKHFPIPHKILGIQKKYFQWVSWVNQWVLGIGVHIPRCYFTHPLCIFLYLWKINDKKTISRAKMICWYQTQFSALSIRENSMVRKALSKTWSGFEEEYKISHINLYMGKYRGDFSTSHCSSLFWMSCAMVLRIPNTNWLNSALKYPGRSIFAVWYMYMSTAWIFYIIMYGVPLPLLFTSQK